VNENEKNQPKQEGKIHKIEKRVEKKTLVELKLEDEELGELPKWADYEGRQDIHGKVEVLAS
jgi:hypothetical protein